MPRRSERRPSGDRLVGRARALEVMLSADDYDADLAERYGWINRALPAAALGEFVRSLAHRVAGVPASGRAVLRDRINAIALAPADDSGAIRIFSRNGRAILRASTGSGSRWRAAFRRMMEK